MQRLSYLGIPQKTHAGSAEAPESSTKKTPKNHGKSGSVRGSLGLRHGPHGGVLRLSPRGADAPGGAAAEPKCAAGGLRGSQGAAGGAVHAAGSQPTGAYRLFAALS